MTSTARLAYATMEADPSLFMPYDSVIVSGSASLYRVPTIVDREVDTLENAMLLRYIITSAEDTLRCDHWYSSEARQEGFLHPEYYRRTEIRRNGEMIGTVCSTDSVVLNFTKAIIPGGHEGILLKRDTTRLFITYAGQMFCHGTRCSSLDIAAIYMTPSQTCYLQFDTGFCNQQELWELISERFAQGELHIPVDSSNCGMSRSVSREISWIDVERLAASNQ